MCSVPQLSGPAVRLYGMFILEDVMNTVVLYQNMLLLSIAFENAAALL